MEYKTEALVALSATLIIIFITIALIILFSVFQKRKNLLLQQKKEDKKKFEKEIAETQIEIREETLRNISWELHDNIGQLLTLAKIQLQNATPNNLHEVSETITKGLTEVRSLSKLINPEAIKNIDLMEAIELEIDRFNRMNFLKASLQVSGEKQKINKKSSIIIFRILQEFFSNTIKHSKAKKLDIKVLFDKNVLDITVSDDGIGFIPVNNKNSGIGIKNIKTRAKLIGAKAIFKSELNQGTSLNITYKL